jgi:hypothetical protein
MKKMIMIAMLLCLMSGCIDVLDPTTGETYAQLDPNVVAGIQTGLGVASGTAQAASTVWPGATLVMTLILIATKVLDGLAKKKLKSEGDTALSALGLVVRGVETLKTEKPEAWAALKVNFTDLIGPTMENIIRKVRGLPPKE